MGDQRSVHFVIDSLGASGAEHSIAALLPALVDRNWRVSVSTLYEAGFGDEDAIRSSGFEVTPLQSRSFAGRLLELRRRLLSARPDVVHTTLFAADVIGRLAAIGTGAAVVSSLVNTSYDSARAADPNVRASRLFVVKLIDTVTARLAVTRFHAVSEGVAGAAARDLRVPLSSISVVHRGRSRSRLGVRTEERRAAVRSSLGIGREQKLVFAAGRQEFQKAHVDLVAAFERLCLLRSDVVLVIAGREGSATGVLRERLECSTVQSRVMLLGHRHDVPDLLCAADVLAISSLYEGTAGVAIEAMALSCPVVCTDLQGVRGVLVDNENAVIVPVGDADLMATALDRVLSDDHLSGRLTACGLVDFERRFTMDVAADGMEHLYLDAIGSRRRS